MNQNPHFFMLLEDSLFIATVTFYLRSSIHFSLFLSLISDINQSLG